MVRMIVVVVPLVVLSAYVSVAARRARRRRDSVQRFADAVSVLRGIARPAGDLHPVGADGDGEPALAAVVPFPLGRPGHRRAAEARPAPDELERRPMVASLPTIPSVRGVPGSQQAG